MLNSTKNTGIIFQKLLKNKNKSNTNTMKKPYRILFFAVFILLVSTGCATHAAKGLLDPPGFWQGLLHGFIILFSFIGSLFTDYEIYAFPNSGVWYNFGFLMGVMIFFGGGGRGACYKRK